MNEFDLIKQYFAPLSGDAGALALQDDAAILNIPPGYEFVVTKDAIVSGTHFIGDEPADLIARKLLRVNLSDLAAMGAIPKYYFLALILPKNTESAWIKKFAQGLAEDQKQYN
ncbi:MAG: AIR synthase related protein, partial [Pseudomonadota bacterium]